MKLTDSKVPNKLVIERSKGVHCFHLNVAAKFELSDISIQVTFGKNCIEAKYLQFKCQMQF